MMVCHEVQRRRGAFLALELPFETESEVRQHLVGCRECRDAFAAQEPILELVWRLPQDAGGEDESFVAGVLAGVHQRTLERRLGRRRRRWLGVAAALLVSALAGYAGWRRASVPEPLPVAKVAPARPPAAEPAFVEVQGEGVRLYQLTPSSREAVQVAFIVDPHLEL